ncbi:CAP domain-containing protein [Olleya aquimaris]|uniref:CAP domain-containing protein n=1 Tax=Olleya sediminilitoris TaxID=2795739 RepID=A0ABS1WM80_9FLAO|nr:MULTISPECIES: CAP domain-containing protein [Olleya]AXO80425.1 CAP domain-containing protein [Olleya aquimaris]MBL7560208.1 CAP domain-containing protein [Olleya sediminilitoris]
MKKLLIVVLVCNTFLMSCSSQDETQIEELNTKNINVTYSTLDYEVVELLNAHRISLGLNSLNILDNASAVAISHSQYMVDQGEASHDNFYSRSQHLKNQVNAKTVSENVAYGFTNAQALVNAWLNSDGHRQNIENPELTDLGIACEKDNSGKRYFTNIFIKI